MIREELEIFDDVITYVWMLDSMLPSCNAPLKDIHKRVSIIWHRKLHDYRNFRGHIRETIKLEG